MIDTSKNQFVSGASRAELEAKVPESAYGPVFEVGEVIPIRGYLFKVKALMSHSLVLSPHGPIPTRQARRLAARSRKG